MSNSLLFTIFAVDKATSVAGKVGGSFNKMALGVAAGAAVIAVKTTSMAANFQTNMLKLQTSAGEQQSNMAKVSNGVLDLATKTGDSTTELAAAMYTVESGGQHGAAGLMVLKAAAQGAKAEGADLNVVADATTSILQDYHLKATDAALVTSKLVATTGAGKTTFEALAGSLHSVLPQASAAHIALSDILGAEASMTVHGMSADQVTQNLSDTIRHLVKPTQQSQKEMGQLGIDASSLNGMLAKKGLTGTLEYLSQTILSKMGPSGKILLGTFTESKQAAADETQMIKGLPGPLAALAKQYQAGSITSKDWTSTLKGLAPEQANQLKQFAALANRASGFSAALKSGTPAAQSYSATLANVMGDATGLNTALMLTGENTAYTNGAVATISKTTTDAGNNVKGWAEIQSTFNVKMAQAREQVEVLGIRIGNALLPYMTKLMVVVGASVGWFAKHTTVAKDLAIGIGALAGVMLLYKTYTAAANVVEKISDAYLVGKKIIINGIKAAQIAYNVVMGLSNSTAMVWLGVQALDAAAWIRKTALIVADTTVMVAQKVAMVATTVATEAWTAATWLLGLAMDATPIGMIVIGIAALVAAIIWVATKTTWFQTAWKATWSLMKTIGSFFMGWGKYLLPILGPIGLIALGAIELYQHWNSVWGFMKSIGAWFAGPFVDFFTKTIPAGWKIFERGLDTYLVNPFMVAVGDLIHGAADALGWVPGIGGKLKTAAAAFDKFRDDVNKSLSGIHNYSKTVTVTVQGNGASLVANGKITGHLAAGGTVMKAGRFLVGENGPEVAQLQRGTTVYPNGTTPAGGGGSPSVIHVEVHLHGGAVNASVREVQAYVREQFSGNVVAALQGHA